MTRVEVLGRDVAEEAYRIRAHLGSGPCEARVPECLMDTLRPGDRPSHQEAYEWIAGHRQRISAAVAARIAGRVPPAPWDLISVAGAEDADGG